MLTAVLCNESIEGLQEELKKLDSSLYQAVELRLDFCKDWTLAALKKMDFPLPVIFTLRSSKEGGFYEKSEAERVRDLASLMGLKPDFLDIEESTELGKIKEIAKIFPQSRIILSHHNFNINPNLFARKDKEDREGPSQCSEDSEGSENSQSSGGGELRKNKEGSKANSSSLNTESTETSLNTESIKASEATEDCQRSKDSLKSILERMKKKVPGAIYKIACLANSGLDALRLLAFSREESRKGFDLVLIGMGNFGTSTRILAPLVGFPLCYCPVGKKTAPGQLDALSLKEIYNYTALNRQTDIYGLLGHPVSQSVGHIFHNQKNRDSGLNAVYIKWDIKSHELEEALELLKVLEVKGLSLTMPLKRKVLPLVFINDEALRVRAVNTLKLGKADASGAYNTWISTRLDLPKASDRALQGAGTGAGRGAGGDERAYAAMHWLGTNTDGKGALETLGQVAGKKVGVIGAGGASFSLLVSLFQAKAEIEVYNRSTDKKLPGNIPLLPLEKLFEKSLPAYDILINTLPFDLDFPFEKIQFKAETLLFDISYGQDSAFLIAGAKQGCKGMNGQEMFVRQALLQRKFWNI